MLTQSEASAVLPAASSTDRVHEQCLGPIHKGCTPTLTQSTQLQHHTKPNLSNKVGPQCFWRGTNGNHAGKGQCSALPHSWHQTKQVLTQSCIFTRHHRKMAHKARATTAHSNSAFHQRNLVQAQSTATTAHAKWHSNSAFEQITRCAQIHNLCSRPADTLSHKAATAQAAFTQQLAPKQASKQTFAPRTGVGHSSAYHLSSAPSGCNSWQAVRTVLAISSGCIAFCCMLSSVQVTWRGHKSGTCCHKICINRKDKRVRTSPQTQGNRRPMRYQTWRVAHILLPALVSINVNQEHTTPLSTPLSPNTNPSPGTSPSATHTKPSQRITAHQLQQWHVLLS